MNKEKMYEFKADYLYMVDDNTPKTKNEMLDKLFEITSKDDEVFMDWLYENYINLKDEVNSFLSLDWKKVRLEWINFCKSQLSTNFRTYCRKVKR